MCPHLKSQEHICRYVDLIELTCKYLDALAHNYMVLGLLELCGDLVSHLNSCEVASTDVNQREVTETHV
jgi:hypothetical protein